VGDATKKRISKGEEAQGCTLPKPFVKWAGGKTQLLPELFSRVPQRFRKYHEPFIGGGALFFALAPEDACISDNNSDLINVYQVVRDNVAALIRALGQFRHCEQEYYRIRDLDRTNGYKRWGAVRKAARLIYLNKTCYNGLYRVNSKGHFNTPFGDYKNPKFYSRDNLLACSKALGAAEIKFDSFEAVLGRAKKGDFVYFDPPYAPLSSTSNFTAYCKGGFDANMQKALRDICIRLDKIGVKFMVSNSSVPLILDLYNMFKVDFVQAARAINSKAAGRGLINEVVVRNY
jgi:DNA adenine methylase